MLNKLKPTIGIIDSGIGGISVLNQLISRFNAGNYIYFADNLNMPYGNMTKIQLKERLLEIIEVLKNQNEEFIKLSFETSVEPCLIRNTVDNEYLYLIMPTRLPE